MFVSVSILASDEELFEDNPDEYIRRDIEGSDVDTRRRAACDLVKVLTQYFEQQIKETFVAYVGVKKNKNLTGTMFLNRQLYLIVVCFLANVANVHDQFGQLAM